MAQQRVGIRNGALFNSSIITNGLVLHLDAGNTLSYPGTGTNWFDLTSNNNDGVLTNGAIYNSNNGGVISFDGVNDYVGFSISNSLNLPDNVTISVWHKLISPSGLDTLFGNGSGSGGRGILSYNTSTSKYTWHQNGSDGNARSTNSTFNTGVWRNLTIVRELGIGNWIINFYIDGVLESSSTTTRSPGSNSGSAVGRFGGFGGHYFNGDISNVQVYNRDLSSSEIQQNYNATKGRFGL